jgi:hypothetical protein
MMMIHAVLSQRRVFAVDWTQLCWVDPVGIAGAIVRGTVRLWTFRGEDRVRVG